VGRAVAGVSFADLRVLGQCKKGDNIGTFLEKCRAQFPELRGISVDNLMYIKVSLVQRGSEFRVDTDVQCIIGGSDHSTRTPSYCPDRNIVFSRCLRLSQHYTFYDFIVNKARGKSGPLFNFDVHDDVRLLHDATKERDEVSGEI
jgi:protein FAM50